MERGRTGRSRYLSSELLDLCRLIKSELNDIERSVQLAHRAWEGVRRFTEEQDHFMSSLALNLHSFYNGLEHIFEAIARRLDRTFLSGERWHRNLLKQMSREIPGIRPAVLSSESANKLGEFLAFRHRVRNLYTFNFEPKRLHELLRHLPDTWDSVKADMRVFCDLLLQAGGKEGEERS